MRKKVLACIYSIVKDNRATPLTVKTIAQVSDCPHEEVQEVFSALLEEKWLTRRYGFLPVYRITEKGYEAARAAYEEQRGAAQ